MTAHEDTSLWDTLLLEEVDAWDEYLEATRGQPEMKYQEVEPWAWIRLRKRLKAIGARRQKLRPQRALPAA